MNDMVNRTVLQSSLKPITPVICGYQKCMPSHAYGPAVRDYWLLHFVVSGCGVFSTKRGTCRLSCDDIFIIKPYEITYYEADAENPWEYIWIGFRSEIPVPEILRRSDCIKNSNCGKQFQDAFSENRPDSSNGLYGYEYYLTGIIWQIFGLLTEKPDSAEQNKYVEQALAIINTEYQNGLSAGEIADKLHLNRSYLSGLFKAVTGKSPGKFLADFRMKRAAELLIFHNCNVTVTANSVGYPDVFSFSRAFRNYYGCSPSEYSRKYSERKSDQG